MKIGTIITCVAVLMTQVACSSAQMLGGISEPEQVSPEAQHAASFAITSLNRDPLERGKLGAGIESLSLVKVKEVRTQVVAGIKYHLVLELQDNLGHVFDIEAQVWSRPWLEASNAAEATQLVSAQRREPQLNTDTA